MRFTPNIRYGTEQYPEKVARRLRAANIAAWIGAAGVGFFAVLRFLQGFAHWKYAALVALAYALVPLLHRFSPFAAPLALVAIAYAWTFWLTINGGVAGGGTFIYFTAGAFGILLIGAERVFLSVLIGAVAVGLLIFLHIGVSPRDTVEYPMTRPIFVFNVIFFSTALFGIIFYAVRQFTFAEERAEREHQRSENLLLNILPPDVALRLKDQPDVAIADAYPDASILFADMAGFTARASKMTPQELVQFLNGVYAQIDNLVERLRLLVHRLAPLFLMTSQRSLPYSSLNFTPDDISKNGFHRHTVVTRTLELRDRVRSYYETLICSSASHRRASRWNDLLTDHDVNFDLSLAPLK